MKTAFFSTKSFDRTYFDKFNDNKHMFEYLDASLNAGTAALAAGFDAVCVFSNDKVDADTIQILSDNGVKLIALRCAGYNNVVLAAAAAQHITVLRVPAYSPQAVAEHAVALILTLGRKTHKAYNRVREGNFSLDGLLGFNLFGKTVGVIGTGRIGAAFCSIMLGFGCRVIAFDIAPSDEMKQKGVSYLPLDQVLQLSDVVSIHCPHNADTHHIINARSLAIMKPGAMLINTSRGPHINTPDVIDALSSGALGYLGLDVYEYENDLFFKDLSATVITDNLIVRLMGFYNVLVTPHQGFFTTEALDEIARITIQNLSDFEHGIMTDNQVLL